MNRKDYFKTLSAFFILFITLFSCTQVSENSNKSSNDIKNNPSNDSVPITVTLIGADGKELKVFNTTAGERVTLASVSVERLSHWNTKADGSGLSYKGAAVFTESVTLYAILLAENAHLINYILNGGVNNPQNPYSFTEDDYIGLKNPTRDNYTFMGWYEDKNFSGTAIKGWTAGDKSNDVTLYAKWEKVDKPVTKITIIFDINGGNAAAPEDVKITSGETVEFPVIEDDTFSHWNTKRDGSGLSYRGAAAFTENIILYAIYLKVGEYKIIYNLNGGVNNPQNPYSFTEDDYIGLKNPTRDNYTFMGWYEDKNFSGTAIKSWTAGDKIDDVTLYAKWEEGTKEGLLGEGVYSYTVKIDNISSCWGGSTVSPAFSIMLLGKKQLENCKAAGNFKVATADEPEYQLGAYGNLKIADTSKTGTFAIYGQNAVKDVHQYYTGVAAEVTETTVTVTIDMTKLVKTDLKALFARNADGAEEATMTNDDVVDLTDYKPYILALASQKNDPDSYQMSAWRADLMTMVPVISENPEIGFITTGLRLPDDLFNNGISPIYTEYAENTVIFKISYGIGYDFSKSWYLDGEKQDATSDTYIIDTSTMEAGQYTVMVKVKYEEMYYSDTTTFYVKKYK